MSELMGSRNTEQNILDAAHALIQTRGYNAFSFKDVARQLGIRAASIHYHFPGKADLGRALLTHHRRSIDRSFARIEAEARSPRQKLEGYVRLFDRTSGDGTRVCLCGVLAAEYNTLPPPMQAELRNVLADGEAWLAKVLEQGRAERAFDFEGPPAVAARTLTGALQGAMMSARVLGDSGMLWPVGRWLLDTLAGPAPAEAAPADRTRHEPRPHASVSRRAASS